MNEGEWTFLLKGSQIGIALYSSTDMKVSKGMWEGVMVKPRPETRDRDPGLSETRDPRPGTRNPKWKIKNKDQIFLIFLFMNNTSQAIIKCQQVYFIK